MTRRRTEPTAYRAVKRDGTAHPEQIVEGYTYGIRLALPKAGRYVEVEMEGAGRWRVESFSWRGGRMTTATAADLDGVNTALGKVVGCPWRLEAAP